MSARPKRSSAGSHPTRDAALEREAEEAVKKPRQKKARVAAAPPPPPPPPAKGGKPPAKAPAKAKAKGKAAKGPKGAKAPAPPPPPAPVVPPLPQWVLDAFSTPNATLMTKGNAKSTFCLNEKDLAGLPVIYKDNPHYRSAAPMCLYKLLDLKAACLTKYGSPAGLAAKSAKNLSAAEKRRDTLAAKPPPTPPPEEVQGGGWVLQ